MYAIVYLTVAAYAVAMQLGKGKKAWQYVWMFPLLFALVGGVEALMAGSFVGLMWVTIISLGSGTALLIIMEVLDINTN